MDTFYAVIHFAKVATQIHLALFVLFDNVLSFLRGAEINKKRARVMYFHGFLSSF